MAANGDGQHGARAAQSKQAGGGGSEQMKTKNNHGVACMHAVCGLRGHAEASCVGGARASRPWPLRGPTARVGTAACAAAEAGAKDIDPTDCNGEERRRRRWWLQHLRSLWRRNSGAAGCIHAADCRRDTVGKASGGRVEAVRSCVSGSAIPYRCRGYWSRGKS